jgi:hypothetical protein
MGVALDSDPRCALLRRRRSRRRSGVTFALAELFAANCREDRDKKAFEQLAIFGNKRSRRGAGTNSPIRASIGLAGTALSICTIFTRHWPGTERIRISRCHQ